MKTKRARNNKTRAIERRARKRKTRGTARKTTKRQLKFTRKQERKNSEERRKPTLQMDEEMTIIEQEERKLQRRKNEQTKQNGLRQRGYAPNDSEMTHVLRKRMHGQLSIYKCGMGQYIIRNE
jgi:hypothetical protein